MLNDLDRFTELGLELARSSVKLLDETVSEAASELMSNIERLQRGDYRDKDVSRSLAEQLDSIRIDLERLPRRMENEVNALAGGTFAITLLAEQRPGSPRS